MTFSYILLISSRLVVGLVISLVSIAPAITPIIFPEQFPGTAKAQTGSAGWSDLFDQAQRLESEDKYLEAEMLYRQILSQPRPDTMNDYMYGYIQIRFGQILQTQGKFTEAIEVLQRVLDNTKLTEINSRARRTLAGVQTSQQNAAQNIARGLQEIQNDPTTRRGYYDLARGLAAQGQLVNGFTFLETNLGRSLTPESALELARAANSQGVGGDTSGSGYRSSNSIRQDALALFRQLVSRYPHNPTVRAEFLDILSLWGSREELIAVYQETIRLDPTNYGLYWLLARELEENNQPNEAIVVYDLLLAQGRNEPRIYVEFGDLLARNQQPDRALQVYLKGIRAFPRAIPNDRRCHVVRLTGYDRLVQLLDRQNRLDQILTIIEQAIPNPSPDVYIGLALALAYQGNRTQAEAMNQRLKERYPEAESWEGGVETWHGGCGEGDY
jgi:tetratricopeptide (TPR) repeat protein